MKRKIKYEYKIFSHIKNANNLYGDTISEMKDEEILNYYGADGWELIHVTNNEYIFKREIE